MPIKHAYFSLKQQTQNGVCHIYLKEDGSEINCTEVIDIKKDNVTQYFSDNIYVGEVVKYSHSIKNNDFIERKIKSL